MSTQTPRYGASVQGLLLGLFITGFVVADAGIIISFVGGLASANYAVVGAGIGLALLVLGITLAHRLPAFTILDRTRSGGARYDLQKNWGQLKIASVLLNL